MSKIVANIPAMLVLKFKDGAETDLGWVHLPIEAEGPRGFILSCDLVAVRDTITEIFRQAAPE